MFYYICFLTLVVVARVNGGICIQMNFGGETGVHSYTCCNNCDEPDSSCRGQTYQGGGSTGDYCNQCGIGTGGGRSGSTFDCGSCNQQQQCQEKCNEKWYSTLPGGCPLWNWCFKACCLKSNSNRKRQINNGTVDIGPFCGDGTCQPGEDRSSCPIDCCAVVNPSACGLKCNNPSCCQESGCCVPTSTGATTSSAAALNLSIILVMSAFFVLVFVVD